ncbi:MAG: hypothetical protein OEZ43_12675 [Gammaproteobacteria bacterium]|nr:hypothetical protein [Gammaproteobacteria bacterium]
MDMTQERFEKDKRFINRFVVGSAIVLTLLIIYIFSNVLSLHLSG